jgi:hypothetical protein
LHTNGLFLITKPEKVGSILGPLLFLIHINDLDTNISDDMGIKLTLFADNTSILITGKDMQNLTYNLNTISKRILSCFDKNRLITNKGKSLALGFHHKLNIVFPHIVLKDRQFTSTSETKFLEVWLSDTLNWDFHMQNLIIKLSKLHFALKTIKSFVNKIVKSYIFSFNVEIFWGHYRNFKKVFKLKKN